MNKNLTEIVLILDRSGSIQKIKSDMEGGLKTFLDDQKKIKGECNITLYQFDHKIERVFENKNIQDVSDIKIVPGGMTALYDAIGTAINEVGNRLAGLKEKNRPSKVLVCVITDGMENNSKEFNNKQIKDMIEHQEQKYSWEFVYLGANQDAFHVGQSLGVTGGNSMSYVTSSIGVDNTYKALSAKVKSFRSNQDYSFSDEDRAASIQ